MTRKTVGVGLRILIWTTIIGLFSSSLFSFYKATGDEIYLDPIYQSQGLNQPQWDVVYTTSEVEGGTIDLKLDFYNPQRTDASLVPAIILAHGGGLTSSTKRQGKIVQYGYNWAWRGYAVISIDYRLTGDNPPDPGGAADGWSGYPAIFGAEAGNAAIEDFGKAYDYVRNNWTTLGIDPNRIAIGGTSAGAIIAQSLAHYDGGVQRNIATVYAQASSMFNTEGLIDAGDPSIFMLHGELDTLVPLVWPQAIATQATTVGLEHDLSIVPGQSHSFNALNVDIDGVNAFHLSTIWLRDKLAFRETIPGDGNFDGIVDAADYTIWADQFGHFGPGVSGDYNDDGVVNAPDYTVWANNMGSGSNAAVSVVPEPSSLVICVTAVFILATWYVACGFTRGYRKQNNE